jgi:HK97 family phage portal protein
LSSILQKAYDWIGSTLGIGFGQGQFHFLWGGHPTASGVSVTNDSALKTIAVQRCISLISGTLAMAPIYGYRAGKNREYIETRAERLFNRRANPEMSGFQYRAYAWQQALSWGAHYGLKVPSGKREPLALWPLPASQMSRKVTENGGIYFERNYQGKVTQYPEDAIFYLPYLITDSMGNGLSLMEAHAEDIGMNQAARAHSASWFKNGARQSIALKVPAKLSDQALQRIRESWAEQYSGTDNAHKPAILEQGMEVETMSVKPSDSQLLETRIQNDEQVCMMFGVPPSMVGLTAKSTSWGSGIAEQVLGFQKFTLGPLGKQLEGRAQLALIDDDSIDLRHDYSELLKPDFKTLVAALGDAHRGGLMTANECRDLLDYDPDAEGAKLLVQMQMVPLADAGKDLNAGVANATNPTV